MWQFNINTNHYRAFSCGMFPLLTWDELTRFISLKSPQKNQGRPVLTLATLWMPVGQVMTINWDLRSPTTATMATQQWAEKPLPVSWGTMGSRCGTKLCHLVKVGETPKELHAYRSMHIECSRMIHESTNVNIIPLHCSVTPAFTISSAIYLWLNLHIYCNVTKM